MNMHKGYTYQMYNYGCLKKKLHEYNVTQEQKLGLEISFNQILLDLHLAEQTHLLAL
jgi:hypothetical protein